MEGQRLTLKEKEEIDESADTVNTITEYNCSAGMTNEEVVEVVVLLLKLTGDGHLNKSLTCSLPTRDVNYFGVFFHPNHLHN